MHQNEIKKKKAPEWKSKCKGFLSILSFGFNYWDDIANGVQWNPVKDLSYLIQNCRWKGTNVGGLCNRVIRSHTHLPVSHRSWTNSTVGMGSLWGPMNRCLLGWWDEGGPITSSLSSVICGGINFYLLINSGTDTSYNGEGRGSMSCSQFLFCARHLRSTEPPFFLKLPYSIGKWSIKIYIICWVGLGNNWHELFQHGSEVFGIEWRHLVIEWWPQEEVIESGGGVASSHMAFL